MARRRGPKLPEGWENVRVGRSRLHGRGLFATRDLRKGSYVMQYLGERVSKKEGDRRTDEQWAKGRVYTFELSRRVDLDGSVRWNRARLANFSCDPNCESYNEGGRRIWIRAMRDIKEGEELTYDYCFPLVEPPPKCHCGAANCRGYIVGEEHVAELKEWLAAQEDAARLEGEHARKQAKRKRPRGKSAGRRRRVSR